MEIEGGYPVGNTRKPGGGRKPSKPEYSASKNLAQQMEAAADLYADKMSLQSIADPESKFRYYFIDIGEMPTGQGGELFAIYSGIALLVKKFRITSKI